MRPTDASQRITLVLGGARSGKSRFAEQLAHKRAGESDVLYVATLEPFDDEMRARVISHRASRPATWQTIEAPYELATGLQAGWEISKVRLALVDCLTIWTSNLLLRASLDTPVGEIKEEDISPNNSATSPEPDYAQLEQSIIAELESMLASARQQGRGLIMVSNEVGMGLVPPYPMGRAYRDMLGRVNQRLARLCDEVFMVLAGMAVDWKALAVNLENV